MKVTVSEGMTVYSVPYEHSGRVIRGVIATMKPDPAGNVTCPGGCIVERLPLPLMYEHSVYISETEVLRTWELPDSELDRFKHGDIVTVRVCQDHVSIEVAMATDQGADLLWDMVREGSIKHFSMGASAIGFERAPADNAINAWSLFEVSLTKRPYSPECSFEIDRDLS